MLSDHGMTDQGGHGGASQSETDTLALFCAATPMALTDDANIPSHWFDNLFILIIIVYYYC